jgi:hypothetical protein
MDRQSAASDMQFALIRLMARMVDTRKFELGLRNADARDVVAARLVGGAVLIGCSLVAWSFANELARRLDRIRDSAEPSLWPRLATRKLRGAMRGG